MFNVFEKNKFNEFLEKRKYFSSPIVFKIIYDKYNRNEIFEQIRKNKINEITNDKENLNKIKNEFKNNNSNQIISTETFQENLIYSFYTNLFEDKILIVNLMGLNFLQYALIKSLSAIKLEKKIFVFLDNNRAIFNRLINFNLGLITCIKFNLVITSSITFFFMFKYLSKRYFTKIKEEKELLENYKRSYLLYNKIF